MATKAKKAHFEEMQTYALAQESGEPSFAEVMKLAAMAAESMQNFCESMDATTYRELRDIANYIETMKSEIGVFQVNDLKESRIPAAGEELDAIIKATEDATNTIMTSAEALMAADTKDPKAYQALVNDHVMKIFEACSFQDITGQRVAKVVETLQMIEARVGRFAEAVNAKDVAGFLDEQEATRAKRKEKLLLNGPQLAGHAIDQKKVDDMFGGE
jgi:chemotaxis protein CheZ